LLKVEALKSVFTEEYRYKVTTRALNDPDQRPRNSQVVLSKYLADFVYENDEPGALFIIYYAGHANRHAQGRSELVLTGG
jgi:hypothetical protein